MRTAYQSRNTKPLSKRFWEKVIKRSKNRCWEWLGATARAHRGVLWVNGRNMSAPRVSWELHFQEEVSSDLFVCHTCNNPNCVNPNHLYLATHTQNLRDASKDGLLATAKDGSKNPGSKLTEEQVLEIRRRYIKGSRMGPNGSRQLAKEFGVRQNWIRVLCAGSRWTHI